MQLWSKSITEKGVGEKKVYTSVFRCASFVLHFAAKSIQRWLSIQKSRSNWDRGGGLFEVTKVHLLL